MYQIYQCQPFWKMLQNISKSTRQEYFRSVLPPYHEVIKLPWNLFWHERYLAHKTRKTNQVKLREGMELCTTQEKLYICKSNLFINKSHAHYQETSQEVCHNQQSSHKTKLDRVNFKETKSNIKSNTSLSQGVSKLSDMQS